MKNNNFTIQNLFGRAILLFLSLVMAGSAKSQCTGGFSRNMGQVNNNTYLASSPINFTAHLTSPTSTNPAVPQYYHWSFGDGSFGTGQTVSHTYAPGFYRVKLLSGDSVTCYTWAVDSFLVLGSSPCTASVSFNMFKDSIQTLTWFASVAYPPNVSTVSWNWGDGSSSNTMYPTHTYSAAGTYSVCVSLTLSCGATAMYCSTPYIHKGGGSSDMITLNIVNKDGTTTSINKIKGNAATKASIAPNPASETAALRVYSEVPDTYSVKLFTITGKLVMTEVLKTEAGTTTKDLDVSHLESGLYFISLNSDSDHKTLRFIKE